MYRFEPPADLPDKLVDSGSLHRGANAYCSTNIYRLATEAPTLVELFRQRRTLSRKNVAVRDRLITLQNWAFMRFAHLLCTAALCAEFPLSHPISTYASPLGTGI
jgi:hypothetical protein